MSSTIEISPEIETLSSDKKNFLKIEKKLQHYTGEAIEHYNMIQHGDKIMVCLSGGKDSFTLLCILENLRKRAKIDFTLHAFTLDQGQPGWDDSKLRQWLGDHGFEFTIHHQDTYSIVKDKIPENKTYCGLCSRLRRGIIYRYAEEHGFTKIALGHHRDDLIRTLLMSILYNGEVRSMPPKLLTDTKRHILIRPLAYCQESDIIDYAKERQFPIIPCNLCGSQDNLARVRVKSLIDTLAKENPKIPSNMLHALSAIKPSQMMDKNLWDFKNLEKLRNMDASETNLDLLF